MLKKDSAKSIPKVFNLRLKIGGGSQNLLFEIFKCSPSSSKRFFGSESGRGSPRLESKANNSAVRCLRGGSCTRFGRFIYSKGLSKSEIARRLEIGPHLGPALAEAETAAGAVPCGSDQVTPTANEGIWESAWNRIVVEQSLTYGRLGSLNCASTCVEICSQSSWRGFRSNRSRG